MKAKKQIIKQYAVLSLLVVYQLITLMHIAYMPRYVEVSYNHVSSSVDFLHKNRSASIPRVQFQRSYHSYQNSRKNLVTPSKILVLFFAFVLTGLLVQKTVRKDGLALSAEPFSQYSYLRLGTLRI